MENNTVKFLWVFIFAFQAGANPLYQWTHDKMKDVFELEYRDDIELGEVISLETWDCVKTEYKIPRFFLGHFNSMYQKDANDIFLLNENLDIDNHFMISVLVHEYAHFFTKKAWFDESMDGVSNRYDTGLLEAIAYFIQDLWLKEYTGFGLLSHYPKDDDFKFSGNFPSVASDMYPGEIKSFLYNAFHWFEESPPERFIEAMSFRASPKQEEGPVVAFDDCLKFTDRESI